MHCIFLNKSNTCKDTGFCFCKTFAQESDFEVLQIEVKLASIACKHYVAKEKKAKKENNVASSMQLTLI